jgi:predicted aconitase with swiveling domain
MIIEGRGVTPGKGNGLLLIGSEPISFLSGVDPETGIIIESGHSLEGEDISGKILVFPYGKGSTVGSYVLYALSQSGHAPAAIVNTEAETIIAVGAIMAKIPMVDRLAIPIQDLPDGKPAEVNGYDGTITLL